MSHRITMHTTDARDRMWVTCSCGWESPPKMYPADGDWHLLHHELIEESAAHLRERRQARKS